MFTNFVAPKGVLITDVYSVVPKDVLFIGIASHVEKAGPPGKAPCSPVLPPFYPRHYRWKLRNGTGRYLRSACWGENGKSFVCALILAQGEGEGG